VKVTVIGAGLAGLNCARILQSANHEVRVIEATSRLGGRVNTDYIDGFQLDYGFQVINPAYAELKKANVVADLKLKSLPKGIEIIQSDQLIKVGDPLSDLNYLSADLSSRTGTIMEKINFLKFMFSNSGDIALSSAIKPTSLFYLEVIKPFLSGVFLCNPDEVSSLMARELLYWFRKGNPGVPENGVAALPKALAKNLKVDFEVSAVGIKENKVVTNQGEINSDAIVVAINQRQAATLLGRGKWSMNQSTTWYHAVPSGAIESKHLRIDPQGKLVNSIVISNIAPSYSPEGRSLVSTTALNNHSDEMVLSELAKLWNLPAKDFELIKKYEIPESLPKHLPGKSLISQIEIAPNLYAIGDYQATPSQQGALLTGRLAAEAIIKKAN